MRKIIPTIIALFFLVTSVNASEPANEIQPVGKIYVTDTYLGPGYVGDVVMPNAAVHYEDWILDQNVSFLRKNDYILTPLRSFGEHYCYEVQWQEDTKTIILIKEDHKLEFQVGSTQMVLDGQIYQMPVECTLIDNISYVPLRIVCETLQYYVIWDKYHDQEFLWISTINLLSQRDVIRDLNQYTATQILPNDSDFGYIHYELKEQGQTARGMQLGDSLDTVKKVYGEPFREEMSGDDVITLYYKPVGYPVASEEAILSFVFKNDILIQVYMDADSGL